MKVALLFGVFAVSIGSVRAGVNAWTTNSPEGGHTHSVYYLPGQSGVAVAAVARSIYRTGNNGAAWTETVNNLVNGGVSIAGSAASPNLILVVDLGRGLLRSDDGGLSFNLANQFASAPAQAQSIAVSANGQVWYGGTFAGTVFRSDDQGATWQPRSNGLPQTNGASMTQIVIDPQNSDRAFAVVVGSTQSLYRTVDGGQNWSAVTTLDCTQARCKTIAVDPANSNRLVVASVFNIYYSGNDGANWSLATGATGGFTVLRFDPLVANRVFASTFDGALFRSIDGGASWTAMAEKAVNSVGGMSFDATQADRFMMATSEGVLLSENAGGTIVDRNSGIAASDMSGLVATADASNRVFAISGSPIGVFLRNSSSGALAPLGRDSLVGLFSGQIVLRSVAADPVSSNVLYVSAGSAVVKSVDGGSTWTKPSNEFNSDDVLGTVVHPLAPLTLYAATYSRGVFRSDNDGSTWMVRANGLPTSPVHQIALDPQNPDTLYAGTNQGIFKSTNAGQLWAPANSGMTNDDVRKIAIDSSNSAIVYVATGTGLYKTTDAAISWLKLPGAGALTSVAIDPVVPTNIVRAPALATTAVNGVDRSVDGGQTWEQIAPGSLNLARDVALDPSRTSNILATALYRGVAELEIVPDLSMSSTTTELALGVAHTIPIRVLNKGPYAASAVRWSSALPAGATNTAIQTDKGSCSIASGTALCQLGALRLNEAANLQLALTPTNTGMLTASIAAHERDVVTSDNSLSWAINRRADIAIGSSATTSISMMALSVPYNVEVINNGPSPAASIQVVLQLPANGSGWSANVTGAAAASATCLMSSSSVTCTIPALESGASANIAINGRPNGVGAYIMDATATAEGLDPSAANNSATYTLNVIPIAAASAPPPPTDSGSGGASTLSMLAWLLLLGGCRQIHAKYARTCYLAVRR